VGYPKLFFFSLHLYDKTTDYGFFLCSGIDDNDVNTVHSIINVPLNPLWVGQKKTPTMHTLKSAAAAAAAAAAGASCTGSYSSSKDKEEKDITAGRAAYMETILTRLIPSLRAFNPSLVLLSSGFDAWGDGEITPIATTV